MTPTSLITRATLDGVAQIYETNVLPADPDTCVLWDCMQVAGCAVLAPVEGLGQGSALHRWIVLDAIESAESVPQETFGKAAIAAAIAWVADPSEENRVAAYNAASSSYAAASSSYAYAAYYAASASAAYYAASASAAYYADAAYAVAFASYAAANASYAAASYAAAAAARLRFRVLATMAQAGVLPNPLSEKP